MRSLRSRAFAPVSLVLALAATAAGLPWLLKNLWFVGNPVFPFLYQFLPARGTGWEGFKARWLAGFVGSCRDTNPLKGWAAIFVAPSGLTVAESAMHIL